MAHRRAEKGSFGGHLDDLIKAFPKEHAKGLKAKEGVDGPSRDAAHVNDLLFESAWRKAREDDQLR